MTIDKKVNDGKVTLSVAGRLDTRTAPELEKGLESIMTGCKELVLDLAELAYISSAGLRVILKMQKTMNEQGTMRVIHVSDSVKEIFDITGFLDILTIE